MGKIKIDLNGDKVKIKYHVITSWTDDHIEWDVKKVNGHTPCDRVKRFIKDTYSKNILYSIIEKVAKKRGRNVS